MTMGSILRRLLKIASFLPLLVLGVSLSAHAQQDLPWQKGANTQGQYGANNGRTYTDPGQQYDPSRDGSTSQYDRYQQPNQQGSGQTSAQGGPTSAQGRYDSGYDALRNNNRTTQGYQNQQTRPSQGGTGYDRSGRYQGEARQPGYQRPQQGYQPPRQNYPQQGYQPPANSGPGQAYAPPAGAYGKYAPNHQRPARTPEFDETYTDDEILDAGHRFFGKVTKGLAKAIAHVFKRSGRPNAYILGEEGSGAWVVGARYGEGTLYTKRGERRRIYWQGPSIGYDIGAEGAKTMVLVYHLRDINKLYKRFAGVDGSAYLVGGIGVTFQKRGRVVLALIRSGVGVRLGANVGYLKYTRRPTWNPF